MNQNSEIELKLGEFFKHTVKINNLATNPIKEYRNGKYEHYTYEERLTIIKKEAHTIINIAEDIEARLSIGVENGKRVINQG